MVLNVILFIVSIVLYASFGWQSLCYIFFSIFSSFFAAKFLQGKHKKLVLGVTLIANLAILVLMKFVPYTNFSILVPLGISYYTLQVVSYLVDVYKQKYEPEKNLFLYALYITYIPHLFIGPISRYQDMKNELLAKHRITLDNFINGLLRIGLGLIKKFVIAGRTAILISTISGNPAEYVGGYALFAMILYSINLYADFSGGIDIVMGISKMLGINLKENFDSPYFSQTIQEFWRRWHISLSSWLKDYVYIPLGGNRKGTFRKNLNLLITFTVSGLWHGVNYVVWGLFHGILVMFGDKMKTKWKTLNRFLTFLIVSFLWSFFIWQNQIVALQMMGSVFTTFNYSSLASNLFSLGLNLADWIVLLVFTIVLFVFDGNKNKILPKIQNAKLEWKTILIGIMLLIVLILGIYGIGFEVSNFIYSNF